VDRDVVGAAERSEVHLLDAVEVHGDVGDVAREAYAGAVGGDVDVLANVGAVELHGVVAVLPLEGIAAVARVPHEGVVPRPAEHEVVAAAADEEVVAVAAGQPVGPVAARDGVVAGAAVHGQRDQSGQPVRPGERVVSAVHVQLQIFGCTDVQEEWGWGDAVEADAGAVGRCGEGLGAVAAVDLDGVDAVAALVEVAAITGVPDHAIVAGLAEDLVVAGASGKDVIAGAAEQEIGAAFAQQDIVAGLAEEQVVAGAANQGVVAGAAEELGAGQGAVGLVQADGVVAGQAEDGDARRVGNGRCSAVHPDGAAVHQDPSRRVSTNDNRVVLGVAHDGQQAGRRDEDSGDGRHDALGERFDGRRELARRRRFATDARHGPGLLLQQTIQPKPHHDQTSRLEKTKPAPRLGA
jgi:hypothetical protein